MRQSINHPRGLLTLQFPSLSNRLSPLRVLTKKMMNQRVMGLYCLAVGFGRLGQGGFARPR